MEWNGGGFRSPFVASGMILVLAGFVILKSWSENYGGASSSSSPSVDDISQVKRVTAALGHIIDGVLYLLMAL